MANGYITKSEKYAVVPGQCLQKAVLGNPNIHMQKKEVIFLFYNNSHDFTVTEQKTKGKT